MTRQFGQQLASVMGTVICYSHDCPCGTLVTAEGSHGLSCRLGPGRYARHGVLNDLIWRGLTQAGVPSVKKPQGMLRSDGKKPDGLTLIPWRSGRCMAWDATVADTVAPLTWQRPPSAWEGLRNWLRPGRRKNTRN